MCNFIVGLGNPGERYAGNRHNVGFQVVDKLGREAGAEAWTTECRARICRANLEGRAVLLVKPLTYMNRSGEAVRLLSARFGIAPQDLLVVLDDLSLPLGRIRLRERGSAGGHHGLESILEAVASEEVLRLRLGIGEEQMPPDKAEFVLSEVSAERRAVMDGMILRACEAIRAVHRDGVSKAMSVFNG